MIAEVAAAIAAAVGDSILTCKRELNVRALASKVPSMVIGYISREEGGHP